MTNGFQGNIYLALFTLDVPPKTKPGISELISKGLKRQSVLHLQQQFQSSVQCSIATKNMASTIVRPLTAVLMAYHTAAARNIFAFLQWR
jgi:hypothetical protein